jgi:hypothetical protein
LHPRTLLAAGLLTVMLGACGCRPPSSADDGPTVAQFHESPQSFVGKSVAMKALPVFWTATAITGDGALARDADPSGWVCVVIVNPRKVTEGVLLCTRIDLPLHKFSAEKAATIQVEGPVKTFVKTDLVAYMKRKHGVDLVTTSTGQPLWIEDRLPVTAAPSDEETP